MVDVTLSPLGDLAALRARWVELEAVADAGPFLSWTFVSRLIARFNAPHVVAVREAGQDLALGVVNRSVARLYLHETGDPALDAIFIEHNGLLCRPGAGDVLAPSLRQLAATSPVVMSGVDDAHWQAAAAAGLVVGHQARFAPALELFGLAGPFLGCLSANARSQIRRAMRLYGSDLAISRATDGAAAMDYFDEMVALHQASWQARGKPGAFADAGTRAFHANLLQAAVARPCTGLCCIRRAPGPDVPAKLLRQRRRDCDLRGACVEPERGRIAARHFAGSFPGAPLYRRPSIARDLPHACAIVRRLPGPT